MPNVITVSPNSFKSCIRQGQLLATGRCSSKYERSYLIEFILVDVFSFPQNMSCLLHNPFAHAKSRKHRLTLIRWSATMVNCTICTGKYLSGVVILASINPQYDNRLYISSSVHENSKLRTRCEHIENMLRKCCVHKLFWISKQIQKNNSCTQHDLKHVLNMFWAWNFPVLNS